MFEVGGTYANRKGKYTVLSLGGRKMRVRYENGEEAELNINIQYRIWENIAADFEAQEKKRGRKSQTGDKTLVKVKHFIKSVSIPEGDDTPHGWQEKMTLINDPKIAEQLKSGDRIIYYDPETENFIAVVTITGDAKMANPKNYFYQIEGKKKAPFFPIDIDSEAGTRENGLALSTIELESVVNPKEQLKTPESLVALSVDDFEMVAETLTEVSEDDGEDTDVVVDEDELEEIED